MYSAASLAGIAGIAGAGALALVKTAGLAALNVSALWVLALLLEPVGREIVNRLRHQTPKGLPELPRDRHPEVYAAVEALSRRAGIAMPKLLYWDIDVPNAAAMGLHLPVRVTESNVLFTRTILQTMPPEALAGVVGHELSHIRHNDVLWGMGAAVLRASVFATAVFLPTPMLLSVGMIAAATLLQNVLGRQREYLADLGGARLLRDPAPLAGGLLRLDIWGRLAAGAGGPVNRFDPGRLLHEHPSTLSRAETLLGLARDVGPARSAGLPARVAAYAAVFARLTRWPVVLTGFVQGGWMPAAALAAAYLALQGLLLLNRRLRPVNDERVRRDFGTYLGHPDPDIRRAVAQAMLDFTPLDVGLLRRLRDTLAAARTAEQEPGIEALLGSAQQQYLRVETGLRLQLRMNQAMLRGGLASEVARAEAERLVQALGGAERNSLLALIPEPAPPAPAALPGGLPDRAAVAKVRFHLVAAGPRAPPALAVFQTSRGWLFRFWHADAARSEAWISRPLWDALTPRMRAGLLYYLAGLMRAETAPAAGRPWVDGTPETEAARRALIRSNPSGFRAHPRFLQWRGQLLVEETVSAAGGPRPSWYTRLYRLGKALWKKAEDMAMGLDGLSGLRSPPGDRWVAFGFAVLSGLALAAEAGLYAFPLGLINYFTALRFINLGWTKGRLWRFKPLAWLLPAAILELAGVWCGAPLVGGLLWWIQSFLAAYLLKQQFRRGVPGMPAVLSGAGWLFVLGLSVLRLGHVIDLIGPLSLSALYMHLARYGRKGAALFAGLGVGLSALFVSAAALLGPIYAGFLVALTAHVLGRRLTRGLQI